MQLLILDNAIAEVTLIKRYIIYNCVVAVQKQLSLWRPNGCIPIWVMGMGHPRDYMTNHLTKF